MNAQASPSYSQEQIIGEAEACRYDHADESPSFFDPKNGQWRLEWIDPIKLGVFPDATAATIWINEEIQFFNKAGDPRGRVYQTLLGKGFEDPVIIGVSEDGPKLWDGFHRTSIALARGEMIPALVGYSNPLVPSLSEQPRIFTRQELEGMDIDDLDMLAFGCKTGDVLELDPAAIVIKYPCDLENPIERFRRGGMGWVRSVSFDEPIEVSVGEDGRKYLEYGHHRRFAAIKLGRSLMAEIEIKGGPVQFILKRQQLSTGPSKFDTPTLIDSCPSI
jgi:hypothetical protein